MQYSASMTRMSPIQRNGGDAKAVFNPKNIKQFKKMFKMLSNISKQERKEIIVIMINSLQKSKKGFTTESAVKLIASVIGNRVSFQKGVLCCKTECSLQEVLNNDLAGTNPSRLYALRSGRNNKLNELIVEIGKHFKLNQNDGSDAKISISMSTPQSRSLMAHQINDIKIRERVCPDSSQMAIPIMTQRDFGNTSGPSAPPPFAPVVMTAPQTVFVAQHPSAPPVVITEPQPTPPAVVPPLTAHERVIARIENGTKREMTAHKERILNKEAKYQDEVEIKNAYERDNKARDDRRGDDLDQNIRQQDRSNYVEQAKVEDRNRAADAIQTKAAVWSKKQRESIHIDQKKNG